MDFFDQRILTSLKDGKPKDFTILLAQVSFSHNTLQEHLKHLTSKGLVVKEKPQAKACGRPKFTYHIPSKTIKQLNTSLYDEVELVGITFHRLRHVCRFEKGGRCKETHKECSAQFCPVIRN
jgi:predicted ArsR family transcriptional regulator